MKIRRSDPARRQMDGIQFASIAEMEAYAGFKALQRQGSISKLQYEPKFKFVVNDVLVGSYSPDFSYLDSGGKVHIIDVKGWKRGKSGKLLPRVDRDFRLRANLMLACFGLTVEVV